MSLESVKEKQWRKCGTSVQAMRLELYDGMETKICDLNVDLQPLGFYSPQGWVTGIDFFFSSFFFLFSATIYLMK